MLLVARSVLVLWLAHPGWETGHGAGIEAVSLVSRAPIVWLLSGPDGADARHVVVVLPCCSLSLRSVS